MGDWRYGINRDCALSHRGGYWTTTKTLPIGGARPYAGVTVMPASSDQAALDAFASAWPSGVTLSPKSCRDRPKFGVDVGGGEGEAGSVFDAVRTRPRPAQVPAPTLNAPEFTARRRNMGLERNHALDSHVMRRAVDQIKLVLQSQKRRLHYSHKTTYSVPSMERFAGSVKDGSFTRHLPPPQPQAETSSSMPPMALVSSMALRKAAGWRGTKRAR